MRLSLIFLAILVGSAVTVSAYINMTSAHKACRMHGYAGACNIREHHTDMCEFLKCATSVKGNVYDYVLVGPAPVGTECGENRVCNELGRCSVRFDRLPPQYFNCG